MSARTRPVRVTSVEPLDGFVLRIGFDDGTTLPYGLPSEDNGLPPFPTLTQAQAKAKGKYLFVWGKEAATYYQTLAIGSAIKEGGDEVRLALPKNHPMATAAVADLSLLGDESWIAGCPRCRGHLLQMCHKSGFTPNVSFETEDYVAVLGLVAEGLGVALIPDLILRSANPPDVVTLPISPASRRGIYVVTTADLQRVPAVKATLDALCEAATAKPRVMVRV